MDLEMTFHQRNPSTRETWYLLAMNSGSRITLALKTRMQSLNPDPKAKYTSIYGALKKIIQTEGFWRPLKGLNVMIAGAGPAHAMYFACYENMKRTLNDVFSHQGNSHLANGILKAFVRS